MASTSEKVRNILERPVASLPLSIDLPRLSRYVRIFEGRRQVFPPPATTAGGAGSSSTTEQEGNAQSRTENVRGIFLAIADRVGDASLSAPIAASFAKTFKATLNPQSSPSSSVSGAPSPEKPAAPVAAKVIATPVIAGTTGLENIADVRLRHALSFLPFAYTGDDDSDDSSDDDEAEGPSSCVFHFVLEKPDAHVTLTVNKSSGNSSATVAEGKPAGKVDCTLKTNTAILTSILQGSLNPAIAFQAGHLVADSMPMLMMFGSSFDLSKDRYAEFCQKHPAPGPVSLAAGAGASASTTTGSGPKLTGGATSLDGVLNNTLKRYLTEFLGDDNKMLRLAKCINSATPSPAMIELKMALGTKYMTKDVAGTWTIDMVFHEPGDDIPAPAKPERRVCYVITRKTEQELKSLFSYSWDLVLRYEFTPGSSSDDLELVDVAVHVSDLKFNDVLTSAEDQDRKDEVRRILSTYNRPPRAHAFLKEGDDTSAENIGSATQAVAAAAASAVKPGASTTTSVAAAAATPATDVEEYDDGSRYEGQFNANGERHGQGVFKTADGDVYVGEYRNDARNGMGVYTTHDGARYEGEFREGLPNGKGVYVFENGDVYTGNFLDDEFHGHGSWSNNTGSSYHGEFKNGQREGHGILFSLGVTYDGDWKQGKFHGHGIFIYRKGDIYEGQFQNGQFHGHGRYVVRESGQVIEGRFDNGKPAETAVRLAADAAAPSADALERQRQAELSLLKSQG